MFDVDFSDLDVSREVRCLITAQVTLPTRRKRKAKDNDLNVYEHTEEASVALLEESKRPRTSKETKADRPLWRVLYSVPSCGRTVIQRVYHQHLRSVHGEGPLYECDDCDLLFYRKDTFKRHWDAQHSDTDNKIQCQRCGAVIAKRRFKEHCKSVKCRNTEPRVEDESMPDVSFDAIFTEIVQEAEDDAWRLQSLGFESVCDALLISFRFLFIAMQHQWSKNAAKRWSQPCSKSTFWLSMLELRGLSIRTILRQSHQATQKEELEGAIEIFELAELLYSRNNIQPQMVAKKFDNPKSTILPQDVSKAMLSAYDSSKHIERRLNDTLSFEFEYLGTTLAVQVLQDGVRNGFLELLCP